MLIIGEVDSKTVTITKAQINPMPTSVRYTVQLTVCNCAGCMVVIGLEAVTKWLGLDIPVYMR